MQTFKIAALLVVLCCISGCDKPLGSKTADELTSDEVYRVMAHARGDDEEKAVLESRRNKDENFSQYVSYTDGLRKHIKYAGGDAGTTTVDQFFAICEAAKAKDAAAQAVNDARMKADQERANADDAAAKAKDAAAQAAIEAEMKGTVEKAKAADAAIQVKKQKMADFTNKSEAEEQQLNADYKAKLKAINDDPTLSSEGRLEKSTALTRQVADQRQAMTQRQQADRQKLNNDTSN